MWNLRTVNFDNFWGLTFMLLVHIFYILTCEELVRLLSDRKNWYQNFTTVKNWYQILTLVKNRYQILISVNKMVSIHHTWKNWYRNSYMWSTGTKSSHMWKLVPNHDWCEELALNRHRRQWQNCEELESNAKWNRFWGYLINMRNMHVCNIKFDLVRIFHKVWDIGTK